MKLRMIVGLAFTAIALVGTSAATTPLFPSFTGGGKGVEQQVEPEKEVEVRVVASKSAVGPGDQFAIAVVFDHAPTWHVHPNKEQSVIPPEMEGFQPIHTEIAIEAPDGVELGPIQWPEVYYVDVNFGPAPAKYGVFSDEAVAYIPVVAGQDLASGSDLSFSITATYQACDDVVCTMPMDETFELSIPTLAREDAAQSEPVEPALFADFDLSVFAQLADWDALKSRQTIDFNPFGIEFSIDPSGPIGLALFFLIAALGGIFLNMTPCVLPVIPIKIMGLSQAAGNPRKCFMLGLIMSFGVVAFWLGIGGAIAFVSGFDQISTLFQRPWFSIVIGAIVAVFAFVAFGKVNVKLPQAVYRVNPSHDSVHGSFLFGIFTAILSTPCTAPLMGVASAWAATQPSVITLGTFTSIGVGMALPYLILSANPKWIDKVPRTGPASELVKQVMGLLLISVSIFFVGTGVAAVFAEVPQPPTRAYWWAVFGVACGAGLWLAWRTIQLTKAPIKRLVFVGTGLAITAISGFLAPQFASHGPIDWIYYTPAKFTEAVDRGEVVVIDFTAEWCLNCKALESGVLHRGEIVSKFDLPDVTPMKVDLTKDNPDGKAKMNELNWTGIPLLAVYGPGVNAPILFGDGYTPSQVLEAIESARGANAS